MTREEAIKTLKGEAWLCCTEKWNEALEMVIKALEQEPSGDLISREETLTAFADYVGSGMSMNDFDALWNIVTKLPSVKQEPETGQWIEKDGFDGDTYYDCSECGESFCLIDGTPTDNLYNYCPNCGAKMVEPQESETWNGIHAQITAPKGTFERIFNEVDDENDI